MSPTGEMAALAKLTSNWRSVIEDKAITVETGPTHEARPKEAVRVTERDHR